MYRLNSGLELGISLRATHRRNHDDVTTGRDFERGRGVDAGRLQQWAIQYQGQAVTARRQLLDHGSLFKLQVRTEYRARPYGASRAGGSEVRVRPTKFFPGLAPEKAKAGRFVAVPAPPFFSERLRQGRLALYVALPYTEFSKKETPWP